MTSFLVLAFAFVLVILSVRYFTFKSMTQKVCSLDPDNDYCRKHFKKSLDKSNDPYKKCDVVYGETPHGGVKTVICYVDDNNNMTSKKEAIKVLVREFDENNRTVHETWTNLQD